MSGRRKKVASGGPIVIHQPSPYPEAEAGAGWRPPVRVTARAAKIYHGDAELRAPIDTGVETKPARRAAAVDALRGLFLLSMTLGFTIQPEIFPVWMYHRQFPPPGHAFVDVAGISWRDVTYGAFLFSMAAAVPITLALRIARGATEFGIIGAALKRAFMLFVFALLIGHSNSYFIGEYTQRSRLIGVIGFLLTFLVFTRARKDWNRDRFETLQRWGWGAVVAFLALSPLIYDRMFSIYRRDDIISALAFAALTGWIIWYFTRRNIPARLAVLAVVVALFIGAQKAGPVQDFWYGSPLPFLFNNSSLVLLCVVIPGTIAGDLILRWMQTAVEAPAERGFGRLRAGMLLVLALSATPILVVGIYHRQTLGTALALAAVSAGAIALSWPARTPTERLVRDTFAWSAGWIMLGMLLEPMGGGMRKVPDNLSYYFAIAGVSMMLLNAATLTTEICGSARSVRFLTDVGQNPMLCYILYSVFLNSLLEMVPGLRDFMRGSQGASIVRSFAMVLIVGLITREFTRRRIFWRA